MSADLVKLIKGIAMDAYAASKPVNAVYGSVTKDIEGDGELSIRLSDKLELDADYFIFGNIEAGELESGDVVLLLQIQGGQMYYVADVISANKPSGTIYGSVTKDYENDDELEICLQNGTLLEEKYFVFGSVGAAELMTGDKVVLMKVRGTQRYYVGDVV